MKSFKEFLSEKEGVNSSNLEIAKKVLADFRKTEEMFPDNMSKEESKIYNKLEELIWDVYFNSSYAKHKDDAVDDVDGYNRATQDVLDMDDNEILSAIAK